MKSYESLHTWREIQCFLPIENRIAKEYAPDEVSFVTNRFRLHIDCYRHEHPRGTVLMLHGVGGNGRLLSFLALPLWQAGYEVLCPDLPLYGLSEYDGTVSYEDWVNCAVEICQRQVKDGPLFLLGLSAGGMLAYQTACRLDHVDGMVVTCLLDQRIKEVTIRTASNQMMAVLGKPFLRMTHRILGQKKIPMKYVCNMKEIVNNGRLAEIMMKDRFSSGADVSLEFLYGMLNPEIDTEPERFYQCPVLLAHPEDDHWTDPVISMMFYDRIAADKKFCLLEGAGHFPIEKTGLKQLENSCLDFMNGCLENNL